MKSFFKRNKYNIELTKLAGPVLFEVVLASLFSMVDMMMLGNISNRIIANASVASVGLVNQILFIGIAIVQSLNVGGTAIIARYLGSNREAEIESVLKHILFFSIFILSIPFFILTQIYMFPLLKFMGAEKIVIDTGGIYYRVIMGGFIFQSINLALSAALRGVGEVKAPMRINILANGLNVFGNAVLIYGLLGFPSLGVTGAAVSTAISHLIGTILLLRYIVHGGSILTINLKKKFKISKDVIYNLVKVGVPASMEQIVLRVGLMLFSMIVAGLGTKVYAAHQISISILTLSFNPGIAIGIATSILVARSLGAKSVRDSKKYIRESRKLGLIFSLIISFFLLFFARYVTILYTRDDYIIRTSIKLLGILAFFQAVQADKFVLIGALRGAGDTVSTLITTISGVLFVRVVVAYILVYEFNMGLVGAWLAIGFDQLVRWAVILLRFKRGKWKNVKIR